MQQVHLNECVDESLVLLPGSFLPQKKGLAFTLQDHMSKGVAGHLLLLVSLEIFADLTSSLVVLLQQLGERVD